MYINIHPQSPLLPPTPNKQAILPPLPQPMYYFFKKKNAVLTKWDKKPNEKDNGAQQID